MNLKNNKTLMIGLVTTIVSLALFVFAIRVVNDIDIKLSNLVAYLLVSTVLGGVAAMFSLFRYRTGLWIYLISILIGFIVMIRTFSEDFSGWEDLTALLALFMIITMGLAIAFIILLIQYLMKRDL